MNPCVKGFFQNYNHRLLIYFHNSKYILYNSQIFSNGNWNSVPLSLRCFYCTRCLQQAYCKLARQLDGILLYYHPGKSLKKLFFCFSVASLIRISGALTLGPSLIKISLNLVSLLNAPRLPLLYIK